VSSFTPEGTTGHLDFSFFPVDLRVVILEPVIAQDQTLFSKSGDGQEHSLGVSLVAENYVHNFGDLSCLIRGTVNIEDRDVMRESPVREPLKGDYSSS